jgi:hypothetical protein
MITHQLLVVDDDSNEQAATGVGARDFVEMHFKL